ncbi:MAG: L-rhamnose mutarotase [Planctomycetota bacterium]
MQRVCFVLQVKTDRIRDYLNAHQVWPEMEKAMSDAGIGNYSMFVRDDGLLVGYLEAEDPEASLRSLGQTDVNRRWQEHMAEYFQTSGDLETEGVQWLDQYYYLK